MKTVLITGANRGIGLETAKQLAQKGLYVYIGCRSLDNGLKVEQQFKEEGLNNVKAIAIDVTKPDTIVAVKNEIEKKQGKLDILINNAGISGAIPQNASNAPIEDILKTFDTNFFGTIRVTQTFLDLLKKSDSPRITNITSGLSSLTMQSDPDWMFGAYKGASYGPSKTALNAYTIALSYELKELSFKVNVVEPGFTATEFNQYQGHGTVEEAAAFIIKHTLTGNDAPTGKFFAKGIEESPW